MSDDELHLGDEKKSSRMTWILVSSGVALLLLGIGTLYFMDMLHAPDFSAGNSEIADSPESTQGANSIYFPLSPFTITFRQDGDGTRFMQVSMTALVQSEDVVTAMQKHEPVIRNDLLLLLSGQDPAKLRTREGKEGLRKLMLEELQTILEKRAGSKGIEEIFFTGFVMQ
jgi:flagellar protein FliL